MPTGNERSVNSTMVHRFQSSMVFNSNPNSGSTGQTTLGDRFTVNFGGEKLSIEKRAENVTIKVEQVQVWNTVPNITETNNTLNITLGGVEYNIVLTKGLYSRQQLNNAVLRGLENMGLLPDPDNPPFQLLEDASTNRVVINITVNDLIIDFTKQNNFAEIVGFQNTIIPLQAGVPINVFAPNVASFNTLEYFVIRSDIIDRGIRENNSYNQAIALVPIDVPPGSNVVYEPRHPPIVDANSLRGSLRSSVTFYLTDQLGRPVDTNGEYFSLRLVLSYTM